MHDEGYIRYEKYKGARLTAKGKRVARETQKRHETLRSFLLMLGIDEKSANEEACKMEHILSSKTIKKLAEFV
jgi:Mn-dependent DtxR family transcriptional regulator